MKFDRVSSFVIIPAACVSALGASFSVFSILQLFESSIEPPSVDDAAQAAYRSVFGLPWDPVATALIGFFGAFGFFGALCSFTSLSRLWRFHLPFVFGLLILISALCVTVSAMSVSSVQIWPVPTQVAILTMFGLFALMGTIHRNP